ncbi:MAG: chromosomal replication initiator protein [Solirubrobacteraceae bacterium]|nr:chromosomal replication initiator protein [Solirubrobacteraceae bacterium]
MPSTDLERHWPAIQAHLRGAVPDAVHQIWFEPLRPVALEGATLTVSAPAAHVRWLADRFARVLQTSAAAELGPDASVDIVAAGAVAAGRRASRRPAPGDPGPAADDPAAAPGGDLNCAYTFDQFVIGEGNRLAHAAALAVAEQPGQAYNPLFLYGPPGVGKTHLLHSIAHYVRAHGGGLTVRHTTIEAFTSGFVSALRHGDVARFKHAYRGTDVLLIDDIQFLEDKARTEEEFFHTFNALYDTGGQLVLTSDRLPRDMEALEERLRERFESGLVADIVAPDLHTRLTILRKRASHDRLDDIDPRALEVIAERVTDNVRALEGALVRVAAFHSLRHPGEPITPALVAHVLDRLYPETRSGRRATVRDIQDAVGEACGVALDDLVSPNRAARISWPRQLAMYLAREMTDATLPAIGRAFGGRDHATVLYAVRRARERISTDPTAYDLAQSLTQRLHDPDRCG